MELYISFGIYFHKHPVFVNAIGISEHDLIVPALTMTNKIKLLAAVLLLSASFNMTACSENKADETDPGTASSETQELASAPSEEVSDVEPGVIAQAQSFVALYTVTANGRFVKTDIVIPRSSPVYVIDDDRHNSTALYKKIRVEEPVGIDLK